MLPDRKVWFGLLAILHVLTPAVTQRVRMCYYTSWSQARYSVSDIDVTLCTHIIYAFAHVNSVDNTIATVQWNDFELYNNITSLKDKNPDLKVLLAIGGFNFGPAGFITVARDDQRTMQFADNAVKFLRQHRFDGLDVDWEFPNPSTRGIYQRFVQRLWERFQQDAATGNGQRLLLTLAVSANNEIASVWYGPNTLTQYVDYILLMTYDFWGPWVYRLAHHSPLYIRPQDAKDVDLGRFSANRTVQTWISLGASRNKLVMGLATYARTATMNSAEDNQPGDSYTRQKGSPARFTREYGLLAYYEVCENLENPGRKWTSVYDTAAGVPYAHSNVWPLDWVSYDNPTSVHAKAEYIVSQNLAGAMIWSLDFDDYTGQFCSGRPYPLISEVKDVFQGQSARAETTSSPVGMATTRSSQASDSSTATASPTRRTTTTLRSSTEVVSTRSPQASSSVRNGMGGNNAGTLPTTALQGRQASTTPDNPRRCLRSQSCPDMFGYFADCTDCSRFFHCSFNVPFIINCPRGLLYQAHQMVCDWPRNVYCPRDDL